MSRNLLRRLAAPAVAIAVVLLGLEATPTAARADVTVNTFSQPSVPLPLSIYAHGNGAFTVGGGTCASYTSGSSDNSSVTLSSTGSTLSTIAKMTSDGYQNLPCPGTVVAGTNNTLYMLQMDNNPSGHGTDYRVVATHDSSVLWETSFPRATCGGYSEVVTALTMGHDGNLYAVVSWPSGTGCSGKATIQGIDASTGTVFVNTQLPGNASLGSSTGLRTEVMPYDDGVAVANNGVNVYYYDYGGNLQSSETFSPSVPSGISIVASTIASDGRTFLRTSNGHVYYKDPDSSTISEITIPTGASLSGTTFYATPSDGIAIGLFRSSTGNSYFGYFDSSGSEVYETNLTVDSSGSVRSGSVTYTAIDNLGNVIVIRTISTSEQQVYVDSFSPTGTKTRLFDSNAEFGTASTDVFTVSSWTPDSIGDGQIYFTLCHQTNPSGGWATTCPTSGGSPEIVALTVSSAFNYPRSEMFSHILGLTQYVALGDSYSSGEGNPPFVIPTDNDGGDGCDRSVADAYPVNFAGEGSGTYLQAFVACSGATSSDVASSYRGEPSQLHSLDTNTDIVTITVGGDDVGFPAFAEACVVSGCGTTTTAYTDTMDAIDNDLLGNLELLYGDIHTAALNATVYVLGYPMVVPTTWSSSCPAFMTPDDITGITNVINGINDKISAAVANAGSGFVFVDPTTSGSPFGGHDLCSSDSYFFGLNIAQRNFSFHPTSDGQLAYAELLADNL